jgi:hypothetical protein
VLKTVASPSKTYFRPAFLTRFSLPLQGLALSLLVIFLYGPALGQTFLSDDWIFLYFSRDHSYFDLVEMATRWYYVRPAGLAWWWLNYQLFGLNAFPYYLQMLLFQIANVLLVYWLAYRLCQKALVAFLSGLLFATFFAIFEATFWLSSTSYDIINALFFLIAFHLFLNFARSGKLFYVPLIALAYAVSLFAKEPGITFIGVLLTWDWLKLSGPLRRREQRKRLLLYAAVVLITVIYLVLRSSAKKYSVVGDFFIAHALFHLISLFAPWLYRSPVAGWWVYNAEDDATPLADVPVSQSWMSPVDVTVLVITGAFLVGVGLVLRYTRFSRRFGEGTNSAGQLVSDWFKERSQLVRLGLFGGLWGIITSIPAFFSPYLGFRFFYLPSIGVALTFGILFGEALRVVWPGRKSLGGWVTYMGGIGTALILAGYLWYGIASNLDARQLYAASSDLTNQVVKLSANAKSEGKERIVCVDFPGFLQDGATMAAFMNGIDRMAYAFNLTHNIPVVNVTEARTATVGANDPNNTNPAQDYLIQIKRLPSGKYVVETEAK